MTRGRWRKGEKEEFVSHSYLAGVGVDSVCLQGMCPLEHVELSQGRTLPPVGKEDSYS